MVISISQTLEILLSKILSIGHSVHLFGAPYLSQRLFILNNTLQSAKAVHYVAEDRPKKKLQQNNKPSLMIVMTLLFLIFKHKLDYIHILEHNYHGLFEVASGEVRRS